MRDTLSLELGQPFTVNSGAEDRTAASFPVYYALDLIQFGIKRDQPAAIRLGEKLMADSCPEGQARMPKEVSMAVKNYMLDHRNNTRYREAMAITGPINSSSVYHVANAKRKEGESTTPAFYCLDDPYWQNFIMKNRRREDNWRNPSIDAWRYKDYGLMGEVFDMKKINERYEKEFNLFN
jgi:hypothetical protein